MIPGTCLDCGTRHALATCPYARLAALFEDRGLRLEEDDRRALRWLASTADSQTLDRIERLVERITEAAIGSIVRRPRRRR